MYEQRVNIQVAKVLKRASQSSAASVRSQAVTLASLGSLGSVGSLYLLMLPSTGFLCAGQRGTWHATGPPFTGRGCVLTWDKRKLNEDLDMIYLISKASSSAPVAPVAQVAQVAQAPVAQACFLIHVVLHMDSWTPFMLSRQDGFQFPGRKWCIRSASGTFSTFSTFHCSCSNCRSFRSFSSRNAGDPGTLKQEQQFESRWIRNIQKVETWQTLSCHVGIVPNAPAGPGIRNRFDANFEADAAGGGVRKSQAKTQWKQKGKVIRISE